MLGHSHRHARPPFESTTSPALRARRAPPRGVRRVPSCSSFLKPPLKPWLETERWVSSRRRRASSSRTSGAAPAVLALVQFPLALRKQLFPGGDRIRSGLRARAGCAGTPPRRRAARRPERRSRRGGRRAGRPARARAPRRLAHARPGRRAGPRTANSRLELDLPLAERMRRPVPGAGAVDTRRAEGGLARRHGSLALGQHGGAVSQAVRRRDRRRAATPRPAPSRPPRGRGLPAAPPHAPSPHRRARRAGASAPRGHGVAPPAPRVPG